MTKQDPASALARSAIRTHFSKASLSYASAARLQHVVEDRLLEQLDDLALSPGRVVDMGCGPGRALNQLRKRFPAAQLLGVDLALPMLQVAKPAKVWWKPFLAAPFSAINADAAALPFADSSLDLLFSNLCIQWIKPLAPLWQEWRRVLTPDATVLLTTFGPDTLKELRAAWASVDQAPHVNEFLDMHDIGDQVLAAGFRNPVLETDHFDLQYHDVMALLKELKAIGASNAMQARRMGIGGRSALQAMIDAYPKTPEGIVASYEVITLKMQAPGPGAPIRSAKGEIASVPISAIRRRQT